MTDEARLRAEVELARSELADTAAELGAKLDVKARATEGMQHAAERGRQGYLDAKAKAPEPVRNALDAVEHRAQPWAAKAADDPRRVALAVGAALLALLVLRRLAR